MYAEPDHNGDPQHVTVLAPSAYAAELQARELLHARYGTVHSVVVHEIEVGGSE